jgi:hypothetical protein
VLDLPNFNRDSGEVEEHVAEKITRIQLAGDRQGTLGVVGCL